MTRVPPYVVKTRFEKRCEVCGRFGQIADPVYLVGGELVAPDELVRTDVEFGSGDEKTPLVVCGTAAAGALGSARLKGLELEPVHE